MEEVEMDQEDVQAWGDRREATAGEGPGFVRRADGGTSPLNWRDGASAAGSGHFLKRLVERWS